MLALGIGAAACATAILSGIFGMGGGMILMGVLAMTLPVAAAMILHGVTQLGANGYRAFLLRRHIRWPVVGQVAGGGLIALALFTWLQVAADRATVLIALGAVPLVVLALPRETGLTIERPGQAVGCGLLFTAVQLIAGASGPILDAFFLRGRLDRYTIVATKASIAVFGHIAKLLYWAVLLDTAGAAGLAPWVYVAAVAGAFAGTRIGRAVLDRVSERQFRRGSIALIGAIAAIYLARGALDLLG